MTSDNRDYYQILGVPQEATFEEIRAAFRERAREYHPDRNPSPDAVDRMQEINEAYEVLRDEKQRALYDRAHRTSTATASDLARASIVAVTVLGEIAFNFGHDIGYGIRNEWTVRIRSVDTVPTGMWHGAFEAALESVLENETRAETDKAGRDAVWSVIYNNTNGIAYRHSLFERAASVTESIIVDISVHYLGMTAAAVGAQLGANHVSERLPSWVWNQVFEAIRQGVSSELARRGGYLTMQATRDGSLLDPIMEEAARRGFESVSSHVRDIASRAGRRDGAQRGDQSRPGAPSVGTSNGCVANIIGTIIMIGIVILLGSLCRLATAPDVASVPARVPTSAPTAVLQQTTEEPTEPTLEDFVARADNFRVGQCVDSTTFLSTSCSSQTAIKILHVRRYDSYSAYPGVSTFERLAVANCPAGWVGAFHPLPETWDMGHRVLACIGTP